MSHFLTSLRLLFLSLHCSPSFHYPELCFVYPSFLSSLDVKNFSTGPENQTRHLPPNGNVFKSNLSFNLRPLFNSRFNWITFKLLKANWTSTSDIFREKQKVTFFLDSNFFYNGAQSKSGKVVVYGDSFALRPKSFTTIKLGWSVEALVRGKL